MELDHTKKSFKYLYELATLEYIVCIVAQLLFTLLCYITNPIVVLFADKYGNLPKCFRLWQTYDNCLDVDWMIYENHVLSIFKYDFSKYYVYHPEVKTDTKMIPGYIEIINEDLTVIERIQRYFCRLTWLYRNTGYGFAYYWLGIDYVGDTQIVLESEHDKGKDFCVSFLNDSKGINRYFCIKSSEYWCIPDIEKEFLFDIYLGWKLSGSKEYTHKNRAMIAFRINPFKSYK